jgi:hypothetical protein
LRELDVTPRRQGRQAKKNCLEDFYGLNAQISLRSLRLCVRKVSPGFYSQNRLCVRCAENANSIFANNIMDLNKNIKFLKILFGICTVFCYV